MADVYTATSRAVREAALRADTVLVGYSGGKDSRVCLDLCCKAGFKKVVALYLYFVPGLACEEKGLEYARQRWKVPILQLPHPNFLYCLKQGVYCFEHDSIEEPGHGGVFLHAMEEVGAQLVVTGNKLADGMWNRRQLNAHKGKEGTWLCPLKDWGKWDVLAYLRMNQIDLPQRSDERSASISPKVADLLWLADNHPEDWKLFCRWFPFAQAVVERRRMYDAA